MTDPTAAQRPYILQPAVSDREVYLELASIDFRELRAPEGEFDDRADAYALTKAPRGYALEGRNIAVIALDYWATWRHSYSGTRQGAAENRPTCQTRSGSPYRHSVVAENKMTLLANEEIILKAEQQ